MMGQRHKQRGVALITALLVVALATTAAVALAVNMQFHIRRSGNLIDGDQAWLYARGVDSFVLTGLYEDIKNNNEFDDISDLAQANQLLALTGTQMPAGVFATIEIEDRQGRFNLNNLALKEEGPRNEQIEIFKTLLQALDLDTGLADAVVDWLDADIDPLPNGAEDNYYLGLEQPYRSANRPMGHISELLLVKGFDEPVNDDDPKTRYAYILDYVTALPPTEGPTKINVNLADAEVLFSMIATLSEGEIEIDLAQAQELTVNTGEGELDQDTESKSYEDEQAFIEAVDLQSRIPAPANENEQAADLGELEEQLENRVQVESNYFVVKKIVTIGTSENPSRASFYTLVRRQDENSIEVVHRSQEPL